MQPKQSKSGKKMHQNEKHHHICENTTAKSKTSILTENGKGSFITCSLLMAKLCVRLREHRKPEDVREILVY